MRWRVPPPRRGASRWWWLPIAIAAFQLGWAGTELADRARDDSGGSRGAAASTEADEHAGDGDAADGSAAGDASREQAGETETEIPVPPVTRSEPPRASEALDRSLRTRDGVALGYDVRWPSQARDLPAVVLLHGGGWWSGDKRDPLVVSVGTSLQRAGFVVVAANYRLACGSREAPRTFGEHDFTFDSPLCGATVPTQVADVIDVLDHVRGSSRSLRIDPERVAVMGMSAGGHLALLAAADGGAATRVRSVVNWSGPPDTAFIATQPTTTTGPQDRSIRPSFTNAMGCELRTCPRRWERASPVAALERWRPPVAVLSLAGEREPQVPFAELERFHERLDALGLENHLYKGSGLCHGAGCATLLLPQRAATALDATIAFLQRTLAPQARAGSVAAPLGERPPAR